MENYHRHLSGKNPINDSLSEKAQITRIRGLIDMNISIESLQLQWWIFESILPCIVDTEEYIEWFTYVTDDAVTSAELGEGSGVAEPTLNHPTKFIEIPFHLAVQALRKYTTDTTKEITVDVHLKEYNDKVKLIFNSNECPRTQYQLFRATRMAYLMPRGTTFVITDTQQCESLIRNISPARLQRKICMWLTKHHRALAGDMNNIEQLLSVLKAFFEELFALKRDHGVESLSATTTYPIDPLSMHDKLLIHEELIKL
jgi:hypothetical protein